MQKNLFTNSERSRSETLMKHSRVNGVLQPLPNPNATLSSKETSMKQVTLKT